MNDVGQRGALRGQASGQFLPAAVGSAGDNFDGHTGRESETSVALVRRLAAVGHVGRAN